MSDKNFKGFGRLMIQSQKVCLSAESKKGVWPV